jgi:hypothetical protein
LIDLETEYEQKWRYLRHVEVLRYQVIAGAVTLIGIFLKVVAGGNLQPAALATRSQFRAASVVAVAVYACVQWFVLAQKTGHDWYFRRLRELEGQRNLFGVVGAFRPYWIGVSVIGSALAGLAAYVNFGAAGAIAGLVAANYFIAGLVFLSIARVDDFSRRGYGRDRGTSITIDLIDVTPTHFPGSRQSGIEGEPPLGPPRDHGAPEASEPPLAGRGGPAL